MKTSTDIETEHVSPMRSLICLVIVKDRVPKVKYMPLDFIKTQIVRHCVNGWHTSPFYHSLAAWPIDKYFNAVV